MASHWTFVWLVTITAFGSVLGGVRAEGVERSAAEQAAARGTPRDAVGLYVEAIGAIGADSPAATSMEYPGYPPFGAAWDRVAELSWTSNARVFPIVRRARAVHAAVWPGDPAFLNRCRHLTNILGDAALYQHVRGEDRAAVELVRDVDHLARLLRKEAGPEDLLRFLVGIGIEAVAMERLAMITSAIRLTGDPAADPKALPAAEASALVKALLASEPAGASLREVLGPALEGENDDPAPAENQTDRVVEQFNRIASQRAMTGMLLAAHLFRHEHGRWPATLGELADSLPAGVPTDPWGDGKQTLGYVLVRGALPDRSDRPLVYSRCQSRDGLFFRTDEPQYGFYSGDGSDRPVREMRRGGQFRDVARWQAPWPPVSRPAPATRPLEEPADATPRPAP